MNAILHVDMDSYFVSVEVLDNPELKGLPVIVGGSGTRGVVASCSYEARAFGVRSAMPSVRARQLCPQAIFVEGHYSRYVEVSEAFREILLSFTPQVEPIGLDEAFLDVEGAISIFGEPAAIAKRIRDKICQDLNLSCAIGIGPTKLVAKLGSRAAKPKLDGRRVMGGLGVFEVHNVAAFLEPLSIDALWGVGPATSKKLKSLGIQSVADLKAIPESLLVSKFGTSQGVHLFQIANGIDPAPVQPYRKAKSLGHEETFAKDLTTYETLVPHLKNMVESVAIELRKHELSAKTISVKVKFSDFQIITRSHSSPRPLNVAQTIQPIAEDLLFSVDVTAGVRLLGVTMSGLQEGPVAQQLVLNQKDGWGELTGVLDSVRKKFGKEAVGTGAMVTNDGISVPERRESPWGPPQNGNGNGPAGP